jgi:tetratricopeptide (TPR) repeat protein
MKGCRFVIIIGLLLLVVACSTETPTPTPVPPTNTPVPTPTAVPTPTPIPLADLLAEADELLWQSEWEDAEAAYQRAIEVYPDEALGYARLAYLHIHQPQTRRQALDEVAQAVDLAPDDPEILAYQVYVLDHNMEFDEALSVAETAYELAPDHAWVLSVLAEVYLDINRYEDALATAELAVEADPDLMAAHRILAITQALTRNWDDADAAIVDAYILHPYFAPIIVTKAFVHRMSGDEVSRLDALEMALEEDPTYLPALNQLAGYHADQEAYEDALEICDQIVELEPELPHGYVCRGDAYLLREVYDEALTNYDLAIDRDVESIGGYSGRGRVFLQQEDCEAARVEFEKILELRPYSSQVRSYIGLAEMCAGEYTAAIESFQQAMEMDPYDSYPLFGLGLAYLGEERYEDAEAQLLAAIEIDDDVAYYYLSLGEAQVSLEKYEEAEATYEQAIEIDPDSADPYIGLGNLCLDQDRYYEAEQQFDEALVLDEESVEALVGLGVAYALQERCGEALGVLDQARELDPDNFVADEVYNQCWEVWRRENPPGPQGDPVDEGTAIAMVTNAVAGSLGLSGEEVVAEFTTSTSGARALAVGYLTRLDPETQPDEFNSQLSQAVFAAVDAFVRADSAPLYLGVDAYGIRGQDVVLLSSRVVHRVDAVDWWNGRISDGAFVGTWFTP